jgi:hypothetical protein
MARRATASEILKLLRDRSGEMRALIGEPMAQLSMPTDGKGLRVLAALPHPTTGAVVILRVTVGDEEVEVPVQISGDFERFRALAASG